MNFIPEDGAEPKPVNPVANPFPVLGLLSAEAPKLKPDVVDEFVDSSDFAPKTKPVEEVFSMALPKVPENPDFSVEVVLFESEDPKNPEAVKFIKY